MGKNVKITLGKFAPKSFEIPDIKELSTHPYGETLMMFGILKAGDTNYRQFFGVGTVVRISHGELFDLVYMIFGNKNAIKKIMVVDNRARRMIMTLKCGQLASFYGYGRIYKRKDELTNKIINWWQLYALGFQGWYIPKSFEVKKIKKEQVESESYVDMSEKEQANMEQFLDQFETTGEND